METHTENVCQICGDIGFAELVATCSKCRTASEHLYCMRVIMNEVPEIWICEACASCEDVELPKAERREPFQNVRHDMINQGGFTRLCGGLRRRRYSEKLKAVRTGKVRFLPAEEVVRLTLGAIKTVPPIKVVEKFGGSCGSSSMTFSPPQKNQWSRTVVAGLAKLTGQNNRMRISSPPNHRAPNKSKDERRRAAKEVQKVEMHMKSAVNKEPHAPPVRCCSPPFSCKDDNFCSSAESKTIHVEEGDPLNILPKLRLYLPFLPAPSATWKGAFKTLDATTTSKLYDGFEAKPPCTVHCKAYQFSKKMPTMLQIELLPRSSVWVNLFANGLPDFLDIALYFFPSVNTERSRECYNSLFELMEAKDSMMRSHINGVELLIFTSKQLNADAQGKEAKDLLKELPVKVSSSECDGMDGSFAADMEIDMVGGHDVGRVDVIITKGNSQRGYSECVIPKGLCWRPPPTGWVKLNVVGKSNWDVGDAAGGIIRDEYGKWIVGYTLNLAKCMGLATELEAVFQGLMFTWERGYRNVLVESESHVMLECLRKSPALNHPNRDLINSCFNLIQRKWDCRCYHIQREANTSANYLANHFGNRPMGLTTFQIPPVDMVPFLQNDSMVAAGRCVPTGHRSS